MNISVEKKGDELKIYIDSILHLYIREKLIGIQSYILEHRFYCIDFYTKHKTITVEYENKQHWIEVLEKINSYL